MKKLIISMVFVFLAVLAHGQELASLKGSDVSNHEISNSEINTSTGASSTNNKRKVVVVTGVRFAYPLIQKWIDDYNASQPDVQIIIESRGSADPQSDILVEAYEPDEVTKKTREYLYVARYAVLPVANSHSAFAKTYSSKGLTRSLITQLYFHDLYADPDKEIKIKEPYTIYTRLQKAGAPIAFTKFFGFEQKDIGGKAIAGSDEHLLKAILRDSTGISYLPLTLIYDHTNRKPVNGLTVLPVDLNVNDRISDDEKFYSDLGSVIERIENADPKELKNLPLAFLHLSVDEKNATPEAISFLKWVNQNGQASLHQLGYLLPNANREKEKFEQFASRRTK
jgi:ABC-type phosphate transport system substrate-binding protein